MKQKFSQTTWLVLLLVMLAACRKDPSIIKEEIIKGPPQTVTSIAGFYLLNEGNMNMNKASLDYYDYTTGNYHRNIYEQANPESTKGLGDVGNDIGIYGSKLYVVVNCSNKIEVMDIATNRRLATIPLINCRYITFHNGKAYASSYNGTVELGTSPNGIIAEIDTTTFAINRTVEVGRQPEEMAVVGNKLYIANSGGYSPPNYERTVSVINLASFTKVKDIDVAVNLHRLKADVYGDLYVSSRGDYYNIPSKLYVVDTKTDALKQSIDIACANLCIVGDTAYVIGSEFSYTTFDWEISYSMVNVKTETLLPGSFITDGSEKLITIPYGIAVDPLSHNIYVTDATDYVTPGILYCFSPKGKKLFTVTTGDIPAHFAFVYRRDL